MTPTDPTTLRTALEALERFVQHYPRLRGLDPEDIYTINVVGDGSHPDILRLSDLRALTEFARAALATPAPAADEARRCWCGHLKNRHTPDTCCTCDGLDGPYTGSCNGFREQCGWCGRTADHEPVPGVCGGPDEPAPAPTPAPPTPPATERCAECAGQGLICLAGCPPPMDDRCPRCHGTGTPPATEPVAALVSELVGDLRLSELGRDGRLDIVARKLDAIVAAARAEVDVERLARALHDQGFGCNAYRCSLGRGSSADAHEQDARFLADAYREAVDDR